MQSNKPYDATFKYVIDGPDTGRYAGGNEKFCYHQVGDLAPYRCASTIVHDNYLLCRFIDEERKCLLHDYAGTNLTDHIANLGKRKIEILPVMIYEPKVGLLPTPKTKLTQHYYVPEEFRNLVRDIIRFVAHLHSLNMSFFTVTSLSLTENFRVVENKLKFWKIGFQKSSNEKRREDYRLVHGVVQSLFLGYESVLPCDMHALMEHLKNYSSDVRNWYATKGIIAHHFAILSHRERLVHVRRLAEMRKLLRKEALGDYRWAVRNLSVNFEDWAKGFAGVLKYVPVEKCFDHQMKKPVTIDESDGNSGSVTNRIYAENLRHLLFSRNLSVHMPDHFFECDRYLIVSDKDMDCMIFHSCGEMLSEFQSLLSERILRYLAKA